MNTKAEERDVVIVGSGPAGCVTAIKLQQIAPELASKTLVIEALQHPRDSWRYRFGEAGSDEHSAARQV